MTLMMTMDDGDGFDDNDTDEDDDEDHNDDDVTTKMTTMMGMNVTMPLFYDNDYKRMIIMKMTTVITILRHRENPPNSNCVIYRTQQIFIVKSAKFEKYYFYLQEWG